MNVLPSIQIKITGAGGYCNYDAEVIRQALTSLGYVVNVTNNHPIEEQAVNVGMTVDEFMMHSGKERKTLEVDMIVNNQPWGG